MRPVGAAGFLVCALVAPAMLAQTVASISGTLVGDDGKPLAGSITAIRVGGFGGGKQATANAAGAFSLASLSAGSYQLCASVKGGGYLDPCSWEATPAVIQVAAGQAVAGNRLTVKKGAALQVRINDAAQVLQKPTPAGTVKPHVLVGVITSRRVFEPLRLTGQDGYGQNRQGTVPLDRPFALYIRGQGVQVTDSSGMSISPAGTTLKMEPGKGNQPISLTFQVQ